MLALSAIAVAVIAGITAACMALKVLRVRAHRALAEKDIFNPEVLEAADACEFETSPATPSSEAVGASEADKDQHQFYIHEEKARQISRGQTASLVSLAAIAFLACCLVAS